MKYNEYQKLASRTMAPLSDEQLDNLHMDLGIFTEVAEILDIFKKKLAYGKEMDMVNFAEEIGDLLWYVVNKASVHDIILTDKETSIEVATERIGLDSVIQQMKEQPHIISAMFMDILVATRTQEGGLNSPYMVIFVMYAVAKYFDLSIEQILDNNIAKLQARYPEKFTTENALNRDLEAERKTLEK